MWSFKYFHMQVYTVYRDLSFSQHLRGKAMQYTLKITVIYSPSTHAVAFPFTIYSVDIYVESWHTKI